MTSNTISLWKSFSVLVLVMGLLVSTPLIAQITDADALMVDIPEPPDADMQLPTPIPVVYTFMGGLLDGNFDACLANFDVETFLQLVFGRPLARLNEAEMRELMAFQIQVHRNEFRFLSRLINRVAKGARVDYSDPRYHRKVQSKVVVRLTTHKGRFDFEVYARFKNDRWVVYDYVINNQRFSRSFKAGLGGMQLNHYISSLRPFYDTRYSLRTVTNDKFGFSIKIPSIFSIRENVSEALLASISGMDSQFLMHIQAATYSETQTLSQAAKDIQQTILPFNPRLYDQWKTDIAGVEIGHVLFHFDKNDKRLFTHMVIIPIKKNLIVLNFYHSTLQLMKNFTNIRDAMFDSMILTKVEAHGGEIYLPPDDFSLPSDYSPNELQPYYLEQSSSYQEIPPPPPDQRYQLTPDQWYGTGYSDYPPLPAEPDYPDYGDDDSQTGYYNLPPPPPPPPPHDYDYDYPAVTRDGEVYF